jgi:hypothetical protein
MAPVVLRIVSKPNVGNAHFRFSQHGNLSGQIAAKLIQLG